MYTFGISLRCPACTFCQDADYYTIEQGFVNLYRDYSGIGYPEKFASYRVDRLDHIVLQKEFKE